MSCYICGSNIDEPRLDPRDMKTCPCSTCEVAIQECLDGYPKTDEESEDDYVVYLDPDQLDLFIDHTGSSRDLVERAY